MLLHVFLVGEVLVAPFKGALDLALACHGDDVGWMKLGSLEALILKLNREDDASAALHR